MKKLLSLILFLLIIPIALAAIIQTTWIANEDDFDLVTYHCTEASCTNVDIKMFEDNSGNSNEIVESYGYLSDHSYASYLTKSCFLPKAFITSVSGDDNVFTTGNINFDEKESCKSEINELVIENLEINNESNIIVNVESAFHESDAAAGTPKFIPSNLKDEFYSSEIEVNLKITDPFGKVVLNKVQNVNLALDEDKDVIFTFKPSEFGAYKIEATTEIVDCQCSSTLTKRVEEIVNVPGPECNDGLDNDGDGFIDIADFGCEGLGDDNEINNGVFQCSNGLDDDLDGFIDQADAQCVNFKDDSEENGVNDQTACDDGVDNDGDEDIDLDDFGCEDEDDNDETNNNTFQCSNGLDDDNDGLIDQDDPHCSDFDDNSEDEDGDDGDGRRGGGGGGGASKREFFIEDVVVKEFKDNTLKLDVVFRKETQAVISDVNIEFEVKKLGFSFDKTIDLDKDVKSFSLNFNDIKAGRHLLHIIVKNDEHIDEEFIAFEVPEDKVSLSAGNDFVFRQSKDDNKDNGYESRTLLYLVGLVVVLIILYIIRRM